ncbi:N-acetylglucosamine-1-phosphotransferase subunits alpha/beta-like [Dendronephthya gigantea]|uniref:N-acetylglucosamine-1-phosphotransferase subunits alpha/beta-like n=1 Tax=Dendronephthya gigantea TaxID=151771 RepID=UPI00106D596D|nr:N-acetylglucosamine-1-phosphotransferase subunits alpha/beta-like [Dendronephthya gigantea]
MRWRRVQRMVCDNFCKLLQRQTYTFLSSRHGMLLCFLAFLLGFVSVLQFGEVVLEWSVVRYQKTLFPYVDNILHKSFQDRLCLPLPIDVVYTWVNGTDPRLLKQLARLKAEMEERLNDSILNEGYENVQDKPTNKQILSKAEKAPLDGCPYKNCVALNTIILKVHSLIKIADLRKVDPVFQEASSIYNVSLKSGLKSDSKNARLTVVKFPNIDSLNRAVDRSYTINGEKVVAQRAYLTSQSSELSVRMRAMALISARKISSNDNGHAFKSFLQGYFPMKLRALDYYGKERVAVLTFKDDKSYQDALRLKKGDLKYQGISLVIEPVLMVWEPFSNIDLENYDNHFSASRFADNQELRYSLRSIEKFAPWVRQIFIVTNGQIPNWLNLDNPRIKIITHAEIFTNQSHLPTFSSPAIESHLHKIPGLSKKFIYLNDDVMFGAEVWPDDFYTHSKGQKVFLSWPVPNCNEGCPATWINDKYCDKACNVSGCDWDGGDCLNAKTTSVNNWKSVLSNLKKSKPRDFCNSGCADSWIGDRYCDGACNYLACGYDGGDCGVKHFPDLHSETLHENSKLFNLPSGLKAMFFNLSEVYGEGKITEGEQDGSSILRSVTIAQKFKVMVMTFYPNETLTTVSIRVAGFKKKNDTRMIEVKFNMTIETVGKVKKVATNALPTHPNISNSNIQTTMYPIRIYNTSGNYWNATNNTFLRLSWPTLAASEYCVPEIPSKLHVAEEVRKKFADLDEELKIGDITQKGYNRKKASLIKEKFGITCDFYPTTVQAEMMYMKSMTKTMEQKNTTSYPTYIKKAVDTRRDRFSTRHLNEYDETNVENTGFLPWERQQVFQRIRERKEREVLEESYKTTRFHQRHLLDAFSGSLLHVNRIYNRAFGYKARKVPSHMPHMVDVDIMNELQAKFPKEFDVTSSHKLRSKDDMQFALSYFYFVIDQTKAFDVSLLFQEVDADKSGTLSDRELRTLVTKFNDVPLKAGTLNKVIEQLRNCSRVFENSTNTVRPHSDRQHGYDLPPITQTLLQHCEPIMKQMNKSTKSTKQESKFKHEIVGEEDIAFKMIKNNATHVLKQLDGIRKNRKKFICLNDNIDHERKNASVVKGILVDFYESLFPVPSQFELPDHLRNQFLYMADLRKWKNEKKRIDLVSDTILMSMMIIIMIYVCWSPIVFVIRKCVGFLRRRVRAPRMSIAASTRLLTV